MKSNKEALHYWRVKEASLSRRLQFLRSRRGRPRCLICSSENIESMSLPSPEATLDETSSLIVFRHPGCEGSLFIRKSDIRVMMALRLREYSYEGLLMKTLDEYETEAGEPWEIS